MAIALARWLKSQVDLGFTRRQAQRQDLDGAVDVALVGRDAVTGMNGRRPFTARGVQNTSFDQGEAPVHQQQSFDFISRVVGYMKPHPGAFGSIAHVEGRLIRGLPEGRKRRLSYGAERLGIRSEQVFYRGDLYGICGVSDLRRQTECRPYYKRQNDSMKQARTG